jgi:hypothetical protein
VNAIATTRRSSSVVIAHEGAISKYTTTIFAKLSLAADDDTNRRVRAVLAYLGAG